MKSSIWSPEFMELCKRAHLVDCDADFVKIVDFADSYARDLRDRNNAYLSSRVDEMYKDIEITRAENVGLKERLRAELEAPKGWQPIETAPKDGFHYLLYMPEVQFVGFWSGSEWCVVAPTCPIAWTQPTHWMPLPPPSATVPA